MRDNGTISARNRHKKAVQPQIGTAPRFFMMLFSAQLGGILGDHELLVGGDDPDLDLGIVSGDQSLLAADLVALGVELDAHELQALADAGAVGGAVLADAGGEHQAVPRAAA